ncbi:MAG: hypothetical protein JSV99_00780 [Planctomycetota bacterium]|nr:MAG: hypothetical protein JSV99_00780 [Planctomycetota bacterium]
MKLVKNTSIKSRGGILGMVLVCVFCTAAFGQYGGGSGTAGNPYLIKTAAQMNAIGANPGDWNKHFKLMADIDLGSYTGTSFNIIGSSPFDGGTVFSGVFDGNGHTISNFTYASLGTDDIGLFGYVDGYGAEIRDLRLVDVDVSGGAGSWGVGSLAGWLFNGSISGCSVEGGNVSGGHGVGGLAGVSWSGTISDCYTELGVSGEWGVGGISGSISFGSVLSCHSASSVVATENEAGVLIGEIGASSGTVSNCFTTGNVTVGGRSAGGLVGSSHGTISYCFSSSSAAGDNEIGGLVGRNLKIISNCYATGEASGTSQVGGLVGLYWDTGTKDANIINSYSVGSVSANYGYGGLVGYNIDGSTTNSFWDTQTSGVTWSAGGTGKTTAELQVESTFTNAGWNFTTPIWMIDEGVDYPRLWWEETQPTKYGGGSGTAEDPYLIYTAQQMNEIGANPDDWGAHFKLMADIDLGSYTGDAFNIIGYYNTDWNNHPFTGGFDGGSHTISNFTHGGTSVNYLGLFGHVGSGAEIFDVGLVNCNIEQGSNGTGSLIGLLKGGTVSNCWSRDGTVSGSFRSGGLVGQVSAGTVYSCFAEGGQVSAEYNYSGGLVGENKGDISDCYAICSVGDSEGIVGGFLGYNNGGDVTHCYSAGPVTGAWGLGGLVGNNEGSVTSSFWDVVTSGVTWSAGGTGKTTAELQVESTFTNAGWDFTTPVWTIDEGVDYPRLWWEETQPTKYGGGSGTAEDPYLIYTAAEMNEIGANQDDWGAHFKLMSDIDLGYYDGLEGRPKFNCIGIRTPYGHTPFTGVFDGNNKTIYNFTYVTYKGNGVGIFVSFGGPDAEIRDLTIESPVLNVVGHVYYAALVARSESGIIRNCHVIGGNISCDDYVGPLVGDNWADIYSCSATTSVSGYGHIGGLVGRNQGRIYESFASGSVSGTSLVGGIAGRNSDAFDSHGIIENSYSTGDVTGDYAGGLVGQQWGGSIVNSYSTGAVSGSSHIGGLIGEIVVGGYALNSFWDVQTSGVTWSAGGTGKTTAEMWRESTFTNAGWDFTTPVWTIDEWVDYPRLAWEGALSVDVGLDELWMYQNLPGQLGSTLTVGVSVTSDPMSNRNYSCVWEIVLPGDVTLSPVTVAGGGAGDAYWTIAAQGCDEPGALSDSGQTFKVRASITGNDYGNTGQAEAEFGIALLGDINNDGVVNVADRSIANAFWRTGSAGAYTQRDCDLNRDGVVNVADRSIANAIWRGMLGQNSVSSPCPLR